MPYADPVVRAAKQKEYVRLHPEARARYTKKWADANKEKTAASAARRYQANKVSMQAKSKAREAARIASGRCADCGSAVLREGAKFCERHWMKYLAGFALGPGHGTWDAVAALKAKLVEQNYSCPYTGATLIPGVNCSLDHKKPKSRFPELASDVDNLEWVLQIVNKAKNSLTSEEFRALCALIHTGEGDKEAFSHFRSFENQMRNNDQQADAGTI